ncbi:MAG: FKBP-type peptidyl-prolyl cis-trans isomerase [Sediminibacterium sp.]
MRTTITLLAAIVLLASCNQYKKTPSGLAYKITGNSKEKLKQGQFVKFNIEFKIAPKDSVLSSSYGHIPAFMVIDTSRSPKHSFLEVISQCGVGDKMEFVMNVDSLKKMGMLEYNNIFHAKDMIKGRLEILKAYANQADAAADRAKEFDAEKRNEIKDVQDFTAKKNIKTQSTRSGALVEIQAPGDMTQLADSGKVAKIWYKGSLLSTGVEFDSNMDPKKTNRAPLVVNVGSTGTQNSVITGLDEALRMFGKGGKGKIYIPAMLGYGDAGSPPVIPTYANLVFEIEVMDVTLPAPPAPQPPMPAMPMKK